MQFVSTMSGEFCGSAYYVIHYDYSIQSYLPVLQNIKLPLTPKQKASTELESTFHYKAYNNNIKGKIISLTL